MSVDYVSLNGDLDEYWSSLPQEKKGGWGEELEVKCYPVIIFFFFFLGNNLEKEPPQNHKRCENQQIVSEETRIGLELLRTVHPQRIVTS